MWDTDTNWIRPLGSGGLTTSAITMGASPLGSMPHLYGTDVPERQAIDTVLTVFDSPIRAIDTSNNYSDGDSERRIGAAIEERGGLPGDFLIATKVDARADDFSGSRVQQSLRESRERLGLETLPLVHLHDPERFPFEVVSGPGGAVEALVELRDRGEIGQIGLAGGNVHEMSRYLALGVFDALLIHNRWTLVDRSATEIRQQALDRGVSVLNAAVYGGGILAGAASSTYGYAEAPRELLDAIDRMRAVCDEWGTDLRTAALQFSLRDTQITSTIVGMSRPERIDDCLRAAQVVLDEEFWGRIEELVPPRRLWLDFRGLG